MLATKIKISQGGRMIVPKNIRKALGIEIGDELCMRVENQELRVFNVRNAIKEAQKLMAKYNPQKKRLSDEIIKDRKDEA